jgi:hypothetical protein
MCPSRYFTVRNRGQRKRSYRGRTHIVPVSRQHLPTHCRGHGLVSGSHSLIDASAVKARVVGREFVVEASRQTTLFDLAKETFRSNCAHRRDTG